MVKTRAKKTKATSKSVVKQTNDSSKDDQITNKTVPSLDNNQDSRQNSASNPVKHHIAVIESIFQQASLNLSNDIQKICSMETPNCNILAEDFVNMKINLKHNIKNLNLAFSCLKDMNLDLAKIQDGTKTKDDINKTSELNKISRETQTNNESKHNININDAFTQTALIESFKIEQSLNTKPAFQNQNSSHHLTDPHIINQHANTTKIMIQGIPKNINYSHLTLLIYHLFDISNSKIKFISKWSTNNKQNYTYLIQLQASTAQKLLKHKSFFYNGNIFKIKKFVENRNVKFCRNFHHTTNPKQSSSYAKCYGSKYSKRIVLNKTLTN